MLAKGWVSTTPVKISSLTVNTTDVRSVCTLKVRFDILETSTGAMNNGDFVALTLPYQWGTVLRTGFTSANGNSLDVSKLNPQGLPQSIGKSILGWSSSTIIAGVDINDPNKLL